MKRIIIAACTLALMPFTARATVSAARAVQIIFVEPAGEEFTQDEQETASRSIAEAAEWWHELSPVPTTFAISMTLLITTTDDVFERLYLLPAGASGLNIYVVDNTQSRKTYSYGAACALPGHIWLTTRDDQSYIVAHEIGHAVFDLLDLYGGAELVQAADIIDIMGRTVWMAYVQHFIGCRSLAALGAPCQRIYLPLLAT